MIFEEIKRLINYAVEAELIFVCDKTWAINSIIAALEIDGYAEPENELSPKSINDILSSICDYAVENGIISENSTAFRDLFDTKIMGILTPRPSVVIDRFYEYYNVSPIKATDYYYSLCQKSGYIRTERIKKDLKWKTKTEYGLLDITINLSKPEKDPKQIAAEKQMKQSGYPKCLLCGENVGYQGRLNYPARQNHRIIPIRLSGEEWALQYSPYSYYNEHCIVFNMKHTPMKINKAVFEKLLDFVGKFPHYFVGSNADLPFVGGSILSHEHFQGGSYDFEMAKAPIQVPLTFKGYETVFAGIVRWPMSVIRLASPDANALVSLGEKILLTWRGYSDEESMIFYETDGIFHNTITPIARRNNNNFELDLVLRNNLTTNKHPLGLFHPHAELHHIKKENIGLIEAMGLAVLPSRLKTEMELLSEFILSGKDIRSDNTIEKHAAWAEEFLKDYNNVNAENIREILENEIGKVFEKVLLDCGVFKRSSKGKAAFMRFIEAVNK
ncbi:MAG: UDP-glucose--hexose-1-phosphate uridylyltransferase [Oscillospiraceae bacterium]|jgi:UDPglucose--hexose-1-phosphate uridylyltransferase